MVTLKDAREVSRRIARALHPISVIVFGSVAKEGVGEDLDMGRYPAEEGLLPLGEPKEEDVIRSVAIATKTVEKIKGIF